MMRVPMVRRAVLGALIAVVWTATGANAGAGSVEPDDFRFENAGALYRLCDASADDVLFQEARHACYGFLYGVGLFYKEALDAGRARRVVCSKGELTRETMREQYVTWAGANPDRMDEGPIEGLFRAAQARWPCPGAPHW
jgi:Rap1a immunity proteins